MRHRKAVGAGKAEHSDVADLGMIHVNIVRCEPVGGVTEWAADGTPSRHVHFHLPVENLGMTVHRQNSERVIDVDCHRPPEMMRAAGADDLLLAEAALDVEDFGAIPP